MFSRFTSVQEATRAPGVMGARRFQGLGSPAGGGFCCFAFLRLKIERNFLKAPPFGLFAGPLAAWALVCAIPVEESTGPEEFWPSPTGAAPVAGGVAVGLAL